MNGNSSQVCPDILLDRFGRGMTNKLWRVNGLMVVNAILMGIVVSIGVCAPRARRNPLIGFLLLGASTLFLPVVSEVASSVGTDVYFTSKFYSGQVVAARCEPGMHLVLVLVWTAVVVTIGVNTSRVVVSDAREGRSIEPPAEMLIKAIWVLYLIIITTSTGGFLQTTRYIADLLESKKIKQQLGYIFTPIMFLPYYKMAQKFAVFYGSRNSFSLARNPRLIVGYINKIQRERSGNNFAQPNGEHPPELLVMGDGYYKVVEQPQCYILREKMSQGCLCGTSKKVTFNIICDKTEDAVIKPEHKDLCFSFALFKLLRCRFAKYSISEAGFLEAQPFFRRKYLDSNNGHEKVFQVIADELSFSNSYYNSSVSSNHRNYAFLNFIISLISLAYCLYMLVFITRALDNLRGYAQVFCLVWCPGRTSPKRGDEIGTYLEFGSAYFDVIPIYLVLAVLVVSEAKDFVFYVCSNRNKVALICRYVMNTPWYVNRPALQRCIGFLVNNCRCKFVNRWGYKISQCSILVHHPRWRGRPRFWILFGFPKENSTDDLSAVKKSIFEVLRNDHMSVGQNGAVKHIRRPSLPVTLPDTDGENGGKAFSACGCKSVADTILAWHIATSLFEHGDQEQPSNSDNKIAATYLSRYCAYLVAFRPELLPDDDDWCKKLYGDVLVQADRVLRAAGRGTGFEMLVELPSAEPDEDDSHKVLKNGAAIARQLKELEKGWKELAEFWSEMILYIAPSENLDAHAEAIARGGEMVTLLWALLAHDGIVDRLDDAAVHTNNAAAVGLDTPAEEAPNTAGDHHV